MTDNDSVETPTAPGQERSPGLLDLASVMIRPRSTIRRIIDQNPNHLIRTIVFLAIVSAMVKDLDLRGIREVQTELDPWLLTGIVGLTILIVAIVMVAGFYILSSCAFVAGRWIGGTGRFKDVRAAIAWGFVPFLWALLYRAPVMLAPLVTGDSLASTGPPKMLIQNGHVEWSTGSLGSLPIALFVLVALLDFTFWVWYFVVASSTLGEAHRFSSWRGFGNLLLAAVLPFATLGILAFVTWVYYQRIGA